MNINDEVLVTVKQIAKQRGAAVGDVITVLIRQALEPKSAPEFRNGVPLFPLREGTAKPDLELVNRLRDGE